MVNRSNTRVKSYKNHLGLPWDWEIRDNTIAVRGNVSYTYLIMGHFHCNGSGYLGKDAMTKCPWLHGCV